MLKTSEELKKQVELKGIAKWTVHECGFCGYPCGYIFSDEGVFYDNGCDCVIYRSRPTPRTWEDVAQRFNINQPENNPEFSKNHSEAFKKHYEVWQF